ncbi:TPA: protein YoaL [Enterobacter mori]|uniref:protein YoaL n=2 Tax=Enterobacteriaceae TaxID=543 RepID=UPI0035E45AE4
MDRHRRQSSTRPFRAFFAGDPRQISSLFASVLPTLSGAPFCHSFSRSLPWNS